MWTFIVLLQSAILLAVLYIRHTYSYWKNRGIPYAEPKFPYGTLLVGKDTPHSTEQNLSLYRKYKNKSPFIGMFFAIKPVVLAIDLEFIKRILITDFSYFHDRGVFFNEEKDPLSGHIFNLEGTRWKKLRAKLTPTFTSGKMKFMFPTLVAVGHEFIRVLTNEVTAGNEIEMKEFLARFTTDVIGSCAFGLECNSLVDPEAEFRDMGRKSFGEPRNSRIKSLLLLSFKSLGKFFNQKGIRDDVSEFFMKAVKETVEFREKNKVHRNDFMDLLLKLKNSENTDERLTLNEIAAQAFVFFLAGFETSSTAMSYALFELAQNQKIQDKARANIREVLERHNGEFTYDSISEMTYVDYCLSESMRKYPPGTSLLRVATKNYSFEGHVIEEGTTLMVPVYSIHHDPEFYPEPEIYRPERFEPEEVAKRPALSYMPFGEGPRICIGLRFGLMQARIGLAMLLHNFRFTLNKKTNTPLKFSKGAIVLTAEGGMYFDLETLS